MHTVDLALQIATEAHRGQLDRDGEPYILHPLTVGLMGTTDEERCAGFLHDVIEDSDWTADKLCEAGVHESVVKAVELLTHTDDLTYDEYVQRPEITKNGKDGNVVLNKKIIMLMLDLDILNKPGDCYIFSHGCMPGKEYVGPDQFNKKWKTIRMALGWSSRYQFYSLKDSGIRDLANAEGIAVTRDQAYGHINDKQIYSTACCARMCKRI